jgi:single-strand DNA-binding protein
MNLNKVFIVGRLTADPQLRSTPSGTAVGTFSIATNRVRLDKNGSRQDETEYHNIVVWGRQAEVASKFLTKGAMAMVEGRLQTRSWTDKQGQTRKTTEIICERLQLGPRAAGATAGQSWGSKSSTSQESAGNELTQEIKEEDIPIIDVEDEGDIKTEELPF